jgi:hypothetical protein
MRWRRKSFNAPLPFSANARSKPFLPPHEGFHSHTNHRDYHSGGSQAFHRAHGQIIVIFGEWGGSLQL